MFLSYVRKFISNAPHLMEEDERKDDKRMAVFA
jgi:hypothetical protein